MDKLLETKRKEARRKILESRLDSGINRLEELKECGIPKTKLYSFYKHELELECALVDYILLVSHIKDNKATHYVNRIKGLIE